MGKGGVITAFIILPYVVVYLYASNKLRKVNTRDTVLVMDMLRRLRGNHHNVLIITVTFLLMLV